MQSSARHAPQTDDEQIDFENASFDGDDLVELGMEEFGHEDIVNTFLETEAPAAVSERPNASFAAPIKNPLASSTSSSAATSSSSVKKKKKDGGIKGPSRRKKRPKGKPRRPLCGYNIFFQRHSKEIQATTPFKDLGRIMGERWKSLTDEERSVYEKEAEKDVVRFRREMDIYEKKRKERLCPSLPSSSSKDGDKTISSSTQMGTSMTSVSALKPPPGWSATNVTSYVGGFTPNQNSFVGNQGPPPLPNTGLHVPGQFVGSPPTTMALPQGTEITLPDATGATRKYRVVYACYRMTQNEANDYMARFAAITASCPQSPAPATAPQVAHPSPSPQIFSQPVIPHPPTSPQISRSTLTHLAAHPPQSSQAPCPPFPSVLPNVQGDARSVASWQN